MRDGFWCFQCPECLIGSAELNRLAEDHELLCEVCLEEGRGEISLNRWLSEAAPVLQARLRGDLAA